MDRGVSPEVAERRAKLIDATGVQHQTIVYPEVQLTLVNGQRPAYYPAAEDAWRQIVAV